MRTTFLWKGRHGPRLNQYTAAGIVGSTSDLADHMDRVINQSNQGTRMIVYSKGKRLKRHFLSSQTVFLKLASLNSELYSSLLKQRSRFVRK